MHFLTHSGYGYSQILCEDVTNWFLSQFFPRHKIDVHIVHRGLKSEGVVGYCDVEGDTYRPRQFLIELQVGMSREDYIKTLLHELWHVYQHVKGHLKDNRKHRLWKGVDHSDTDYDDQPWEQEAHRMEDILYQQHINFLS